MLASYYYPKEYEYSPTNILTLSIEGGGDWGVTSRRNFSDNTRRKLEGQITDFIAAIHKLGEIEKQVAVLNERESCRRRCEEERIAQQRLERQLVQQKLEKIETQLKNWQHAEEIRQFVRECMKRAAVNTKSIKSFSEFNEWVKMALAYADTFDPLITEFGAGN
jgi:hypothetical protein